MDDIRPLKFAVEEPFFKKYPFGSVPYANLAGRWLRLWGSRVASTVKGEGVRVGV